MTAGVGIVGGEGGAGVAVYDDGGECRVVALPRLMVVARIMTMPVTARIGGVGCENDRSGDRDQPENANPQDARGSQGCAKHELPRPNFCLDHRFVRPNYAQRRRRFPAHSARSGHTSQARMADLTVIQPKTLYANKFSAARPEPGQAWESG